MPSMKLRNVESSILLQHAHVPKGEDEEGETNEKKDIRRLVELVEIGLALRIHQ